MPACACLETRITPFIENTRLDDAPKPGEEENMTQHLFKKRNTAFLRAFDSRNPIVIQKNAACGLRPAPARAVFVFPRSFGQAIVGGRVRGNQRRKGFALISSVSILSPRCQG